MPNDKMYTALYTRHDNPKTHKAVSYFTDTLPNARVIGAVLLPSEDWFVAGVSPVTHMGTFTKRRGKLEGSK